MSPIFVLKSSLVAGISAAFGVWVDRKIPGLTPEVAAGVLGSVLAYLFHILPGRPNGNG